MPISIGNQRDRRWATREWLARVRQDIGYAWRGMQRSPAFATAVAATLGLAIAATTSTFSLVYGVLFRPLPFAQPDRVFSVVTQDARSGDIYSTIPGNAYVALRAARTLESLASYSFPTAAVVLRPDGARDLRSMAVTPDLFRVLGVFPFIGRAFTTDEAEEAGGEGETATVVVMTYDTWRVDFNADPGVIGHSINLDGRSVTVVGVLPQDFWMPGSSAGAMPNLLVPSRTPSVTRASNGRYVVLARVRPGVPVSTARAEVTALTASALVTSGEKSRVTVTLRPVRDLISSKLQGTLLALLGAVGFVLLIACVNIGNMTLARGHSRRQELAVRVALGARRARLVSQLVTESVLLALVGGAVGVAASKTILVLGASRLPSTFRQLPAIALDFRLVLFALTTSVACGLCFAIVPAIRLTRADLTMFLGGSGGAMQHRAGSLWGKTMARGVLVTAEVSLALILLTGAGLLVRTVVKLQQIDLGYDPSTIATVRPRLPRSRYPDGASAVRHLTELRARLSAVPGVSLVAAADLPPFSGSTPANPVHVDGGDRTVVDVRRVSAGYFALLGMQLHRGRIFADGAPSGPVGAVINDELARRYWGSGPAGEAAAIGRSIAIDKGPTVEVIGVVSSVREGLVSTPPLPTAYIPIDDPNYRRVGAQSLLVRSHLSATVLGQRAQEVEAKLDRYVSVTATDLDDARWRPFASSRFYSVALGAFAVLALFLAAIGLAGVIAEDVNRRTREIGIRIALGARGGQVIRAIVLPHMVAVLAGLLLGATGAWCATRLLKSLLYEVVPSDVPTLVGAGVSLAAVAVLASVVPARRAARIDAMRTLRE